MGKLLLVLVAWVCGFVYFGREFFKHYGVYKPQQTGPKGIPSISQGKYASEYTYPDCTQHHCSWLSHLSNNEYERRHPNNTLFYVEADEDLQSFIHPEDPPLKCIPESFGYTAHEAAIIFPKVGYPTCQKKLGTKKQIIYIDTEKDELVMDCKGEYYLGVNQDEEKLGNEKYNLTVHKYKGKPVKLKNKEEWAFGTCEEGKTTKLEGATYSHRPKKEAYERAKAKMEQQQKLARENFGESETRPVTVLMLVFDSISRKHFYRKLPNTAKFLNSVDPDKFRISDYKIQNVMGDNSMPNVYPVWTGKSLPPLSKEQIWTRRYQNEDLIENRAIWTYLREKGFVTLFTAEFCDHYFSMAIGRKPSVDHLQTLFWCAAERLTGFNDCGKFQRCVGNRNSHYHMLNYTYQFIQNYEGVNKWAHIMSLPGHEDTGTVIETLDDDLVYFLQKYMSTKDELAIFLMADHGMRYGEWFKLIDGSHEHKLPMLFTIISTSLAKDIPGSLDNLHHNSNRLVSKLDLHRTLKHLGNVPYYRGYTRDSPEYQEWITESPNAISLLLDKVPNYRGCDDINIPPYFCSCTVFRTVDEKLYNSTAPESPYAARIFSIMVNELISQVNSEAYTPFKSAFGHICQKVHFDKIESAEFLKIDLFTHFYKLIVSVKESHVARFEAVFMISSNYLRARRPEQAYPLINIYIQGRKQMRIMYIKRQDPYAGLCEELCKLKQIQPPLCICNSLERIKYHEPKAVETLKKDCKYFKSSEGQSCSDFCSSRGEYCDEVGLNLFNTCEDMMQSNQCSTCTKKSKAVFPGVKGSVCYINNYYESKCDAKQEGIFRHCACKTLSE